MTYLTALGITLLSESVVVIAFLYRRIPTTKVVLAAIIPSLITHPCLWFYATKISWSSYAVFAIVTESIIVIIEAVIIWLITGHSKKWSLLISLTANAFSVLVGILLQ